MRQATALFLGLLIATSALASDIPYEDTQLKGQATYVVQRSPGFHAPYAGPNSLNNSGEEGFTFTSTAYLGTRLWRGGEAYLNIELGKGDPLSGLTGLGGFANGEATRVSGNTFKAYRQRLFLRQTWALSEDSIALDSDFNQMAGLVARDRFVLTVGNFSTLDIFDDNAYAKDPRTQFLNWGNMAHTAFDYAADARGFGWGFAGEWYQGDWVLRFGRMTGPKDPNGLPTDYRIGKHFGDQIELEHAHELAGQPGKVRLLAFRNRARVAVFNNATAWLAAHPGSDPQSILMVREGDRTKYGIGLNIEQAINNDLGVFLRASHADGRSETYAFTEVDGSLAAGLALKGNAWQRPADTFGLAWLRNTLSPERQEYLKNGGISFFIGDGRLNYRPESIIEAYYSWQVVKQLSVTADLQRVANPAYNADRGPANIFGLRLHAEF